MILDSGKIRGGFKANYEARIAAPADSEMIRAISVATGVDRSPKVDVEVARFDGKPWSIAFSGTIEETSLLTTPNPDVLGVSVSGWSTTPGFHIVDTRTREVSLIVEMPIECSASDLTGARLFLATCIDVTAFDGRDVLWRSRRVSLDGIKMLVYAEGAVCGIGTEVPDVGTPFAINAATGEATGGFIRLYRF